MNEVPIISVEAMRRADAYTIENGVPGKQLMLEAAKGVFESVNERRIVGWYGKKTAIFCGGGNNGGDGYALAMILKKEGDDVTLIRVSEKMTDDGAYYFEECKRLNVSIMELDDVSSLEDYDIIVDCILGTGFSGEPTGAAARAIDMINKVKRQADPMEQPYVVCCDINSGLDGDTGRGSLVVASDLTVSIGYYKHGVILRRDPEVISLLTNVDIGIQLPSEESEMSAPGRDVLKEDETVSSWRNLIIE